MRAVNWHPVPSPFLLLHVVTDANSGRDRLGLLFWYSTLCNQLENCIQSLFYKFSLNLFIVSCNYLIATGKNIITVHVQQWAITSIGRVIIFSVTFYSDSETQISVSLTIFFAAALISQLIYRTFYKSCLKCFVCKLYPAYIMNKAAGTVFCLNLYSVFIWVLILCSPRSLNNCHFQKVRSSQQTSLSL